jgi:hypothetical protein
MCLSTSVEDEVIEETWSKIKGIYVETAKNI